MCFQSINQKSPRGRSLIGYEVLINLDELGGCPQDQHQGAI